MAEKPVFGSVRVRFDPWSPDYGASLNSPGEDEAWYTRKLEIDTCVEMAEPDWRGIPCALAETDREAPIAFVDGVRRMEANLVFEQPECYQYGGYGCCAAGAMVLIPGRINEMDHALVHVSVQRYLFAPEECDFGESIAIPADYPAGSSLMHLVSPISGADPTEPMRQLQQLMRQEEALIIDRISVTDARVVIADGPLSMSLLRNGVAGFIKSLHSFYVSPSLLPVLAALQKHERSPMFRLYAEDATDRYSAYVRIQNPRARDTLLAGIARFEVAGSAGLEQARQILDYCAAAVPLFASPYGRDPRAPQNLLPISALEMELRRRLGSQDILRRLYQSSLM